MLKVINYNGDEIALAVTKFPDGTSQVWKLSHGSFQIHGVSIVWEYENEAELIQLNQLVDLLQEYHISIREIHIPFLPYGRQDKEIDNGSTFGKSTFLRMLPEGITITSFDVHSGTHDDVRKVFSLGPKKIIQKIFTDSYYDYIIYPDRGAALRYGEDVGFEYVFFDKVRNQSTGVIERTTFRNDMGLNLNDQRLLIIDDICDYGGTFVNAASIIKSEYPDCEIGLYVSHGLFHGGFAKMEEAGIDMFYTTDTLAAYRKAKGLEYPPLHIYPHQGV